MHRFNWVDSILRNGKTLTRYNKSDAVISSRTRRSSQVTSHVIFPRENARDARHAQHGSARVWHSLSFFPTSQIENNSPPI
jgi:hypothetical protein